LQHLDPGRRELVLVKDGYPKTARTVDLKPGSKGVLEVELGTGGGTEPAGPGRAEGSRGGPSAPKGVPLKVQLVFTVLKDAAAKGTYAEARQNLRSALGQPDMADFKAELGAAIGVVQVLESRQDAVRRGAERLVGKTATLVTNSGSRKGHVERTSVDGIILLSRIMVNGRPVGESRSTIRWSDLALAERNRLAAGWMPEGVHGAVARAVLALAAKDEAGAERAARSAGDHPLGKYLSRGTGPTAKAEGGNVKEMWRELERRAEATGLSAAEELQLSREIRAFGKKYEDTKAVPLLRRQISDTLARAKQSAGFVAHWAFDEGMGTAARDSSGNKKHGRIRGARWAKGKIGYALRFDGIDDWVELPDMRRPPQMTLAAWVKLAKGEDRLAPGREPGFRRAPPGGRGIREIIGWGPYRGTAEFRIAYGQLQYGEFGHLNRGSPGAGIPASADWTHVAATKDGAAVTLYVNGEEVRVFTTKLSRPSQKVTIGCLMVKVIRGVYGNYFAGLMDDLRMYKRVLSAEDVKALATVSE
ncbi:MAG: LamG domain-containing protein, partial [Planctomycetota bacterium]